MKDYYVILGIPRTASPDEIKQAYRKLASKHHPDRGGDTVRFQEIQEAYSVLSDPVKKQQYDHPEMNTHAGVGMPAGFDFDHIFSMFGTRFTHLDPHRSVTTRLQLWISLQDVASGGRRQISVTSSRGSQNIEIEIPVGINDGESVRYANSAPSGSDLIVTFRVRPCAEFVRNGSDLTMVKTLMIWDLILGCSLDVQTVTGAQLQIQVPENTQPGTVMRIKSHGLKNSKNSNIGDLFVKLEAKLPNTISDVLRESIRQESSR